MSDDKISYFFFMPMIPPKTTHNSLETFRRKNGSVGIRKSDALKSVEAKIEAHLAKHKPKRPLRGAVKSEIVICWQADAKNPQGYKVTKPDNDNMEKVINDCMERLGFFEVGDQQIARNECTKCFDEHPGIFVRLEEIE